MTNLADELGIQARLRPEAIALQLPNGTLSFRQLDDLTWRAASLLHLHGVRPGEIVVLSCASELALLAALFATARIGATAFSLPINTPPLLCAEMAKRVKARFLATDRPGRDIAGLARLSVDLDSLAAASTPLDPGVSQAFPPAPWLIISGSGSTGHPRLFTITQAQFHARAALAGKMLALTSADRFASLAHLDFTSPKERCFAALFAGATVVLFDRKQANPLTLCRDQDVTVLDATVFHLEQMLGALPAGARNQLGMLRALQVSASTVSDGLRRRIAEALTRSLYVRYGTNETGLLAIAKPMEALGTPGTVGYPPAGTQIEVVDVRGRAVPVGETGLIRVSSPGMIAGYLDDEPATRRSFKDGCFFPGDLGRFAANGQLIHCGRADHMMIMNGINIYPAEIERVLSLHPAVRDAAAVPLASAMHQDIPVCAVVWQGGASFPEKQLVDFAAQRLGSHGPKRIVALERIPRNEQGKLIRPQLMAQIRGKLARKNTKAMTGASPRVLPFGGSPVGMRQPARQMPIRLHCATPVDLDGLDDWLASVLEIEIEPCLTSQPAPDVEHELLAKLAWRVLLLTRALLQAGRIPVFDPGRVVRIDRDRSHPAQWVATVAVAHIEHVPSQCYSLAGDEAAALVQWMAGKPRTPENASALFDAIERQVLRPLHRRVMAGKSTLPVLRAAYALDIPFNHLGAGVYQLGWGSKSIRLDRSTTAMDSAIGSKLAQNKAWSANLLRSAGLPAPRHQMAASREEAMRVARRLGWPVVVKPADRDRGEGVTVGVTDDSQLLAAFKLAQGLSKARQALVEREVAGVCHRLFIANGQLLYAVKRLPKSIHGDGCRTVAELIRTANQDEDRRPPWLRTERYPDDAAACEAMAAAGFGLEAVPAAGERVPLRKIETTAWGGFDEDVTRRVHPDNLDIALRAAALFDLQVAGIDIITSDIGRPWHATGAVINEVNFAPLLGGGEISRRHVPEFLARLIEGDGRIPVEAIIGGGAALDAARARQKELAEARIRCVVTSHETTLSASGEEIRFTFKSLYRRCKSLLLDKRVDAIVLVIQTDELLQTGLPADCIDRVAATGDALKQARSAGALASQLALLRTHARRP